MTIINNIEIDFIRYKKNAIKDAILNNEKVEDKLHVIAVISNPCLYATRYILMKEFIQRMENDDSDIILYIVELAYKDQKFLITNKKNKRHLQIRCDVPLWHKENMINLGVKKLLPETWKAFAWVDADLEFENANWASDTLRVLNGCKDIVQLFSHCDDMDREEKTMRVFNSAGFQYEKGYPYCGAGPNFWHPGYAWACTRKAYEKMGGLYDVGILGSGDHVMSFSLLGRGLKAVNEFSSEEYKETIVEFEKKSKGLRLGYIPGLIRHHYHGSKQNRKYSERWQILLKHNYNPLVHIKYDENGIIVPTENMSKEFIDDIYNYFAERNEDER
jgi:hypothetical protein